MFNQFGSTAETLSKASSMVFRIGTDAHLYDDPEDVSISPLLDSKFDSEKCEALKRLLALIAQGFDVSNFFPQVVKNVASQSLEVKKLVYLYLLHYAEKRPNEALLSINTFQKDLGDPNPLVRAWALRTMAGIRLHIIAPLVLAAVGKCARDPSVYVRRCAANALPKLNDLRLEEHIPAIEEIVGTLLNDRYPGVVGAAAAAFATICPNNFALIGKNYKRLCEILPDVEDWGQILLIEILLRYCISRHGLVQESIMVFSHGMYNCSSGKDEINADKANSGTDNMSGSIDAKLINMVSKCYVEGPDEYLSWSSRKETVSSPLNSEGVTSVANNDDVRLLLQCVSPLLWSNNSAVVLAAAGVLWIMAPREDVKRIVRPLLFLLRSSSTSKYVVLCNIQVFAKAMPCLFALHFEDFFIHSSEAYQVKALKLEILSSIATVSSVSSIFREFEDYIRDPDRKFAADTIAAMGLCAKRLPQIPATCLNGLLTLIRQDIFSSDFGFGDGEAGVLVQAIMSIQTIIKEDPLSHEKVIVQLFCRLDSIKVPAARALIIWMVGTYSSLGDVIPRMLTTVLKYLAWGFKSEALETKLQILNTIAKVLSSAEGEDLPMFKTLFSYVVELAECDLSYDVRDRARFLKKLLSWKLASQELEEKNDPSQDNMTPRIVADHVFGKLTPVSVESTNHRFYLPGSLSQIVLHAAPGYEPLPKPCSFIFEEQNEPSDITGISDEDTDSESDASDFDGSDYESRSSAPGSSEDETDETNLSNKVIKNADPLIQISDVTDTCKNQDAAPRSGGSVDLEELMSTRALDLWLDEQPRSSDPTSSGLTQIRSSSANISIGDLRRRAKPKSYTLLDPVNGNGMKVEYLFSSEVSTISPQLVCVEVFFENCSSEPISGLNLEDEESSKASDSVEQKLPESESMAHKMEGINRLEPGQTAKRVIHVHFPHHLLPLKLTLHYNDKKLPVKLRPDIGYFVKPLPMSIETFEDTASRLPGMFEYSRRCTFSDHVTASHKKSIGGSTKDEFLVICESIALKMLSNTNLFFVSADLPVANKLDDASGLCLRFSSKILSGEVPLLISVTAEGKCSEPLNLTVKINCEETVFGLNLLNRIVNLLIESSSDKTN